MNSPLEENFLHPPPLTLGIFEYGKYIWVETYGFSVWICMDVWILQVLGAGFSHLNKSA